MTAVALNDILNQSQHCLYCHAEMQPETVYRDSVSVSNSAGERFDLLVLVDEDGGRHLTVWRCGECVPGGRDYVMVQGEVPMLVELWRSEDDYWIPSWTRSASLIVPGTGS